jgi:hypothetical protein
MELASFDAYGDVGFYMLLHLTLEALSQNIWKLLPRARYYSDSTLSVDLQRKIIVEPRRARLLKLSNQAVIAFISSNHSSIPIQTLLALSAHLDNKESDYSLLRDSTRQLSTEELGQLVKRNPLLSEHLVIPLDNGVAKRICIRLLEQAASGLSGEGAAYDSLANFSIACFERVFQRHKDEFSEFSGSPQLGISELRTVLTPAARNVLCRVVLQGGLKWHSESARDGLPVLPSDASLCEVLQAFRMANMCAVEPTDGGYVCFRSTVNPPLFVSTNLRLANLEALTEEDLLPYASFFMYLFARTSERFMNLRTFQQFMTDCMSVAEHLGYLPILAQCFFDTTIHKAVIVSFRAGCSSGVMLDVIEELSRRTSEVEDQDVDSDIETIAAVYKIFCLTPTQTPAIRKR